MQAASSGGTRVGGGDWSSQCGESSDQSQGPAVSSLSVHLHWSPSVGKKEQGRAVSITADGSQARADGFP